MLYSGNIFNFFINNKFYFDSNKKNINNLLLLNCIGKTSWGNILDIYTLFVKLQKLFYILQNFVKDERKVIVFFPKNYYYYFNSLYQQHKKTTGFFFLDVKPESGYYTHFLNLTNVKYFRKILLYSLFLKRFILNTKFERLFFFNYMNSNFKDDIIINKLPDFVINFDYNKFSQILNECSLLNILCSSFCDIDIDNKVLSKIMYVFFIGDLVDIKFYFYISLIFYFFEIILLDKFFYFFEKFREKIILKTKTNKLILFLKFKNLKLFSIDKKKKILLNFFFISYLLKKKMNISTIFINYYIYLLLNLNL